jgi:alpha-L-rhamnosidase
MKNLRILLLLFMVVPGYFKGYCINLESLQISKISYDFAEMPGQGAKMIPRFSWIGVSGHRGAIQKAYQVEVGSTSGNSADFNADMWNSGKVYSGNTLQVPYSGKPLVSNKSYFYRITIWDGVGNKCTSLIDQFRTAIQDNSEWLAKWIGAVQPHDPLPPKGFFSGAKDEGSYGDSVIHDGRSMLLRHNFQVTRNVRKASVSLTGLGLYEFFINGEKVGDHQLSPAKTPYHKEILYDSFDVTGLLSSGANVLAIHLGNGWYNPYKKWWQEYRMQWFGHKKAILQLRIEYMDGSIETVLTDRSWKTSPGPSLYNCIYDGELYDASKEPVGWMMPGFDDTSWNFATEVEAPRGALMAANMPPVRIVQKFDPVKITKTLPGSTVYDFGQNFAGWTRVLLKGKRGSKISIRYSEELDSAGNLDLTCNENARATAEYILKGEGTEVYEPHFTYFGFQFAELVSDSPGTEIIKVEGCVVHSDNLPKGSFNCDNELVNKIHRATLWSQKSNMLGYPMDCPQRDERLGWMGDAQVTAEEAMFNFDMARFYRNWFSGIRANQDPATGDIPIISPRPYIRDEGIEWSSTYLTMIWDNYRYYGDKQLIDSHYEAMSKYFRFLTGHASGFIQPKGWIGDWGSRARNWKEGDPESVPTAYYYLDAILLAKMAGVTGRTADSVYFAGMAGKIKEAYNKNFFHPEHNAYHDGSQMANAFPLYLDLVPREKRNLVLNSLVNQILVADSGHLTTGVLGTKYLPEVLTENGRSDIAWMLVNQKGYPSWSQMMEKYNTMCEFWTLKQSHNHVMMGSIDSWFYEALAGVRLLESYPAYGRTILKPYLPDNLNRVDCTLQTVRGEVKSSWEKDGSILKMIVEIPFNCQSEVWIPGKNGSVITESGKPVNGATGITFVKREGDFSIYKIGSGNYRFEVREPAGKF